MTNLYYNLMFYLTLPLKVVNRLWHKITYLPYSIHLGKKINVKSHSKVRSPRSEVHKCVSISLIFPKMLIQGH